MSAVLTWILFVEGWIAFLFPLVGIYGIAMVIDGIIRAHEGPRTTLVSVVQERAAQFDLYTPVPQILANVRTVAVLETPATLRSAGMNRRRQMLQEHPIPARVIEGLVHVSLAPPTGPESWDEVMQWCTNRLVEELGPVPLETLVRQLRQIEGQRAQGAITSNDAFRARKSLLDGHGVTPDPKVRRGLKQMAEGEPSPEESPRTLLDVILALDQPR